MVYVTSLFTVNWQELCLIMHMNVYDLLPFSERGYSCTVKLKFSSRNEDGINSGK